MPKPLLSPFLAFSLTTFAAIPSLADADGPLPAPVPCETRLANPALKKGNLFTAIRMSSTELGKRWAEAREEALSKFPNLRMKEARDLHVTVNYIGDSWSLSGLAAIRKLAAPRPSEPGAVRLEMVRMGRNNQSAVVEFEELPADWVEAVIDSKTKLNELGLKKPDRFDSSFRAHVTLAETASNPPTEEQSSELQAFLEWAPARLGLGELRLPIGPSLPIELLLADADRPAGSQDYVSVDEFLSLHCGTAE